MRKLPLPYVPALLSLTLFLNLAACDKSDDPEPDALSEATLTLSDTEALYFMLEEEKLARDVYRYLGDLWDHPTFLNIEQSEVQHVSSVVALLEFYSLPYELLPEGIFLDSQLQGLYNDLIQAGTPDLESALEVGAQIEDLDIADLETYLQETVNPDLIRTFESLQCGSRNHLRSFSGVLESLGTEYEPQYISEAEYLLILSESRERCGL